MMVVNFLDLKEVLELDSLEKLESCASKNYHEFPPQLNSI